jgi:hypothetical protein
MATTRAPKTVPVLPPVRPPRDKKASRRLRSVDDLLDSRQRQALREDLFRLALARRAGEASAASVQLH